MKKNLAIAMLLAAVTVPASAADLVLDAVGTANTNAVAGPHTVTGVASQTVGSKMYTLAATQQASFVKVVFSFTAGNNVYSALANEADKFSVASVSTKGNQIFGGNSTAGAVKLLKGCPATGCGATATAAEAIVEGTDGIVLAKAMTNT